MWRRGRAYAAIDVTGLDTLNPRAHAARLPLLLLLTKTYLLNYSGIIFQTAGFSLIVPPFRSPDKAKLVRLEAARRIFSRRPAGGRRDAPHY